MAKKERGLNVKKGNGLALDRCSLWGIDTTHEDDCFRVVKYREYDVETRENPVVANHIPYIEALALVTETLLEELQRTWTPEEIERWLEAHKE